MAKMIPPFINPDVKSGAERRIFELLRDSEELSSYTCLHSFGLSRHSRKRQGEVDFVLVGNGSIICFEVKGGRVTRKDGIWLFKDRYGQENKKTEGPFAQVSTAMFSLKNDLEARLGKNHGYLFGYGVIFPDIEFSTESPEWDKSIVYDLRDVNQQIHKYIERVISYWRQKTPQLRNAELLPKSEVVNYLRGDFDIATLLWSDVTKVGDEIAYFTNEQYRALDQMDENPRLIFEGAAGTGKTLLAVEKARRNYHNKQRTLLLCFNRLLGARLRHEAALIDPSGNYLHADSIHKYFSWVISNAGLKTQLDRQSAGKKSQEVYNEILPSLFITAAEKSSMEKFDSVIIDEGQDLLNESYLLAIECVLKGGLKNGYWTVFLDPGGQAKLFNRYSLEAYQDLKSLGAPVYKLDLNVRNTLQIATQASIVSGFPAGNTRVEGPKVEYKLCNDPVDMALKTVELINKLVTEESIPPSSITVLSSRSVGSMSLFSTGVKVPRSMVEATENSIVEKITGKIYYSSVQSYKGLENDVIIFTDLDSFDGDFSESVNYVAMTRAKGKLYVFMDKKLNGKYQERVKSFTNIKI
ncbi:hypothetical protein A3A70_02890 [candidate division WWE3 bacterium RIFCSPLOWO2_01_FULL_42_11]|uniref:DNA helicase n=1 Tax=candidate division WWE3 bacterium RIFCSPLOWO2_01_FULL_42_11 TaxID=1802627 RepID=A0A1F4VRW5_UNCKA|nr:MAG: hypothetical protein A3A70_02890 [candidate division WWE3 bacterium RIFCSPLOWO2_01_FULL_42_11]